MIQTIVGKKTQQSQKFLEDGTRIPVTTVYVGNNSVIAHRTQEKNGYTAVQVGFGTRKKANKALLGHVKGANIEKAPFYLREVKTDTTELPPLGTLITASDVLKPGDMIDVTGTSKGKGFAGVVKRHGFRGGPRTHGQSDRERAPGSIGQTTTPGRVYRGKKMAGRMGQGTVTVKNLEVVAVDGETVLIGGIIPGSLNSLVMIHKIGENANYVPVYTEKVEVQKEPEEKKETQETEGAPVEVQPEVEKVEEVEKVDVAADDQVQEDKKPEETAAPEVKAEAKIEETEGSASNAAAAKETEETKKEEVENAG